MCPINFSPDQDEDNPASVDSGLAVLNKIPEDVRPFLAKFDLNYYESCAHLMEFGRNGSTEISDEQIITYCGLSVAYFNNLFLTNPDSLKQYPWREAIGFFADGQHEFQLVLPSYWSHNATETVLADGLKLEGRTPAMVFDSQNAQLTKPAIYDQLEIKTVNTKALLQDFTEVAAPAFGIPEAFAPYLITADFGFSDIHQLYVGYLDGKPVSTSLLFVSQGVAGIYWVATAQDYRGKGLGEALTYHATKLGLEQVDRFACLQASELGEPVYTRMGYQTWYHYVKFLRSASLKSE